MRAARTLQAARGAATPSTPSACEPPGIFLGCAAPLCLLDPEMCPTCMPVGAPCTRCLCPACPVLPVGSPHTAGDPQGHPTRRGGSPMGCPILQNQHKKDSFHQKHIVLTARTVSLSVSRAERATRYRRSSLKLWVVESTMGARRGHRGCRRVSHPASGPVQHMQSHFVLPNP